MIHKFSLFEKNFVLDVNSGALHEFSNLSFEILKHYFCSDNNNFINSLEKEYSKKEILECIKSIKKIKDDGLLFSVDFSNSEIDNFRKNNKVLKALCMNVAHVCNLNCKYCFASGDDYIGEKKLMSFDVGRKCIDYLIKNSGNRINLEIDFFGGEPLLNFDVIKKIINYAREKEKKFNKKFRFTITTNALLLDNEKIGYINKNMFNVVLSLDGRKEINNKMRVCNNDSEYYSKIISNIKKFIDKREDKSYYIRGTFTRFNLDFVEDILCYVDLGFKNLSLEPVVCYKNLDYTLRYDDLEKIFDEYEKLAKLVLSKKYNFNFFHFNLDFENNTCISKKVSGCGCGNEYLAVSPNGNLYPCHQFVGQKSFLLGNIYNGIKKKFENYDIFDKQECVLCWAKFFCSGGCHANNFLFNKSFLKPYKLGCDIQKKRLECALAIKSFENNF